MVSLRDPEQADERPVDVAGVSLLLNGFKDDPKWADFVAEQVTVGLPALEELVGTPWPGGLERIREDASPVAARLRRLVRPERRRDRHR